MHEIYSTFEYNLRVPIWLLVETYSLIVRVNDIVNIIISYVILPCILTTGQSTESNASRLRVTIKLYVRTDLACIYSNINSIICCWATIRDAAKFSVDSICNVILSQFSIIITTIFNTKLLVLMDYVIHSNWTSNRYNDKAFATTSTVLYTHLGCKIQHPDIIDFRVLIALSSSIFWRVYYILFVTLCTFPIVSTETVVISAC